jgi:hypothetical protein
LRARAIHRQEFRDDRTDETAAVLVEMKLSSISPRKFVTNSIVAPDPNGPGGLRLAELLPSTTLAPSDTFNLASTRVVTIPAAGARRFFFKISAFRMDEFIACFVYNAVFSVSFVP